jgi:Uma2 family endonuclease
MAEPVRTHTGFVRMPEEWTNTLLRYVEGPDGELELREIPLTPEEFLDPQIGDTMVQGNPHAEAAVFLYELLNRRLRPRPGMLVTHDLKHLIAPRLGPAPDVSVFRGLPKVDRTIESYDIRTGISPCLIIEVVSPGDSRVRQVDEVTKVGIYERIGVEEYLLLDLPRRANGWRHRFRGYRLNAAGRYAPIQPDAQGSLLAETIGISFGVTPENDRIQLFDTSTGERLLSPFEAEEGLWREAEARRAAEERVQDEAEARRAAEERVQDEAEARGAAEERATRAEAEASRLREEIERLRERLQPE